MSYTAASSRPPTKKRALYLLRQVWDDKQLLLTNVQDWINRMEDHGEREEMKSMIPDLEYAHDLIEKLQDSMEKGDSSVPEQFSNFWTFFNNRFPEEKLAKDFKIAGVVESTAEKMGRVEKEYKGAQNAEESIATKRSKANDNSGIQIENAPEKLPIKGSNERHSTGTTNASEEPNPLKRRGRRRRCN
ncbi:unnamed protein product [Caenorhabditis nigoni]